MAPPRPQSIGKSPASQQRQITSFFTKNASPSPSPSPINLSQPKITKPVTKHNPSPSPNLSSNPTTPSSLHSKPKKPVLVIGRPSSPPSSTSAAKSYGDDVVGKRIKVYWPLDKKWYEGHVKSYDNTSGKHLVEYDDGEEESLELGKERIEFLEGETGNRLKRLRRGSMIINKFVIEDEEIENEEAELKEKSDVLSNDDSSDEDWEKNGDKEITTEDENENDDLDLVDEKDDKEDEKESSNGTTESRKRKAIEGGKLDSAKKSKGSNGGPTLSVMEPVKNTHIDRASDAIENGITGDITQRFGTREAEKLWFLGKEQRKDGRERRPGHANFDPNTLYLPPSFVKALSGGQRQWWEFKSQHMDKVIFFKMGKFYELFEMDAHVGAKELDLQYMRGEQPHCGFPEKNFSINIEKLARKGYRVLVVEQTETPQQLEIRRKEKGSKDKVVKREICGVVTKGTLTEGEMLSTNPNASYLMAVTENCQDSGRNFGVCVVDVPTSRIILGQFKDNPECSALCCLLSELRPVEIIKPAKQLSQETERVIKRHTRNPLVNELAPSTEFWDRDKTVEEIKTLYKRIIGQSASVSVAGANPLPETLSELEDAEENGSLALSALGGTLYYLRKAFLDESLLRFAKFELLPFSDFSNLAQKPYMVLDATALENLEIFENSNNGGSSGTLYSQLNHCITASGKRLLKKWLARPLYHAGLIKERQDAIDELRGENHSCSLEYRKALSRLPDIERLLARVFASSEANGRNGDKVTLYEDASKKKLQEFVSALRGCETMSQACSTLGVMLENVRSRQLQHLVTPGQGLPDVFPIVKHFKDAFDWAEAYNSGRIVPNEGADMEYDSASKIVKEIEYSLTKHLKEQRKLLGDSSITYVTITKEEYLLEVPESLRGSVPKEYELRSSKKGFFRYWTPTIKKLLGELSKAESEKEAALKTILQRLITRFCEDHEKWRLLVSATAELDVLISLAIASEYFEGPRCRPVILGPSSSSDVPCFTAKGLGHPLLRSDSVGKGAFVPNDIALGGDDHARFILLTGPNMGGKSTLLRQVCLTIILAQLGADVPAESFELSPVDRIFVRMGAKDHIMAGQSTFLTELSETALMLSSATRNSLVALDELGRGTATSDGQAIAESVLEHFVHKVQCRGMFSTHYHRLAVDYQRDPKVSLCHMACHVGNGIGGIEEVTFLYRLTPGACPKSYGVNVARLAGIPDSVLHTALAKSQEFEAVYGKSRKKPEDKMAVFIKKLKCLESSEFAGISSLTELQHRARLLL